MGPGGPAEASVDKPRVLIAEDESEIAEVARSMVEALVPGAVVETVADGRSALRRMLEFRPHLLLADLRLPSCDGYVLCPSRPARSTPRAPEGSPGWIRE